MVTDGTAVVILSGRYLNTNSAGAQVSDYRTIHTCIYSLSSVINDQYYCIGLTHIAVSIFLACFFFFFGCLNGWTAIPFISMREDDSRYVWFEFGQWTYETQVKVPPYGAKKIKRKWQWGGDLMSLERVLLKVQPDDASLLLLLLSPGSRGFIAAGLGNDVLPTRLDVFLHANTRPHLLLVFFCFF